MDPAKLKERLTELVDFAMKSTPDSDWIGVDLLHDWSETAEKINEIVTDATPKHCETCKWWTKWNTTCERVDGDDPISDRFDIHVRADDDQGLTVSLLTGPKFGCVKHEKQSPQ